MNDKNRRNLFLAGGQYHLLYDRGFSGYAMPHRHSFYQLILIESGRITQMYGDKTYSQLPGDIFLTSPDMEHSLFVFGGNTIYYALSFSEDIFLRAAETVPGIAACIANCPPFFTPNGNTSELMLQSLKLLMHWPEHDHPGTFTCGCHVCTATVILLLSAMQELCAEAPVEAEQTCKPFDIINSMLQNMDQHYNEDIKIETLVKMSALSKSTFCTYFNRIVGTTPKQYITEKRMREALRLIRETDMPFAKIADDVGYNDFSTFFRNFSRMTGQSPTEYRAQQSEGRLL